MAQEIPRDQMAQVLPELHVCPRLLNVYAMVKLYLEGRQNGSTVNLFRCAGTLTGSGKAAVNWLALKQNDFGKPEIFFQATTIDPEFIRKSTLALMELVYPLVESYSTIELVTATEIADVVHEYFREKSSHPYCPFDEPNYYYYASEPTIAWLKQADVSLPDGFEFVNLYPEQADEMVKVMLHADEDDAKMVELRLAKLPGVGVRFVETGELAAFEYTDGFGFLANLYTVPKFRHQGIGTVLERRLSQRIAFELGLCPAKNVSLNRPRVVKMTEQNPLWTPVHNEENGEKQVMRWGYLCKEQRADIIIHEN